MRTSSSRVFFLLLALGACIAILAGMIAWNLWRDLNSRLESRMRDLRLQIQAQDFLLQDAETVLARDRWIRDNQPRINDSGTATATLLANVRESASRAGVKLDETKLLEPTETEQMVNVALSIKATASVEGIVRLLHDIQRPELFQSIEDLTLKRNSENEELTLDLRLVRHYAQGN